jgi:hypothetical protein
MKFKETTNFISAIIGGLTIAITLFCGLAFLYFIIPNTCFIDNYWCLPLFIGLPLIIIDGFVTISVVIILRRSFFKSSKDTSPNLTTTQKK